ncbi:hypothetical protein O6H91_17G043500 [Diphasiastrum complanatum]|uniref:Uncharacterized protein n=1 Tax=Diphasiastrum complanatum TaxID=34168 RepID=A0ACC2B645_DIPCM|nr:hypothetical protein O6H91_17G043500 [Diphasiastrum complanatum]
MGTANSEAKDEAIANFDGEECKKDSTQFSEGEKVLAYHGLLIYEAKIQRAEFRKKECKYFVHYLGWSKNWDEWVGADRLMKVTEANLEKQRKLFKYQNGDKRLKGHIPQGKLKVPIAGRGKKRKSEFGVEDKEGEEAEHLLKLQMPGILKKQLVDDWELISQLGKLIKLPRSPNVEEILKKYLEFKLKRGDMVGDSLVEVLNGLRSYFDKALPALLLYKAEREQYAEVISENNTSPSSIYGAEHLLRLFVKLPDLLAYTNMEEEALNVLQQKLADFLRFLQKNQSSFFVSSYDGPQVEIHSKAQKK